MLTKQKGTAAQTLQNNNNIVAQEINPAVQIIQLPVSRQGSDLQCAYHTAKNIELYLQIAANNLWINEGSHDLNYDERYYAEQFNIWKQEVLKTRHVKALHEWLINNIVLQYAAFSESDQKLYKEVVNSILRAHAEQFLNSTENEFSIFKDTFKMLVQQRMTEKTRKMPQDKKDLTNDKNIESLFSTFEYISIDRTHSLFLKNYVEDLQSDEIEELIPTIFSREYARKITLLDDYQQIESAYALRNEWQDNSNYYQCFFMGTMSEQNRYSSGHWFMFIAQKINGEARYFVADSLGTDRTQDERVLHVITMLNQELNEEELKGLAEALDANLN